MFVTLGGKFLQVAGKFATSIACCCGYDSGKWYCLTSTDGSYRCAQDYDIEADQMLSEHATEAECNEQCGVGNVYCYYGEGVGYYCTDYFDEGYLSGPYPSTIECNEACKQMWFCVDKGSSGGETQYECTLQDPVEDYLSGPYGSKDACEYRCGNLWWCTYRYINTDEYEYECVQDNTGAPDNAVSGPYGSDAECEVACQICEEIILPEQKDCPDCVDDACVYLAGDGGIDGGQWGTCCAGLIETWRYCDGDWELILPCHPIETRTAGTPACEVYPESLDFPDDPVEGQLYTVECDRVLGFDPSDYPDCEDCDYNCVETDGAYDCELDPAGPHKTLQDCIDKCPDKWGCISTDECVQKPDGTYATETECVDNAPVDCAATGACCFPDGDIPAHCHDDAPLNQEGPCIEAGGTFYANESCSSACPSPVLGACCYRKDGEGTCTQYNVDGSDYGAPDFATKEEAQSWIDEGNCPSPGPDEPDCGMSVCYPYDNEGAWTPIVAYRVFPLLTKTAIFCHAISGYSLRHQQKSIAKASHLAIYGSSWQNDLPATDCLDLPFDDCNQELTGGTGKFNENEGCVGFDCNDPNRSISFAPPP